MQAQIGHEKLTARTPSDCFDNGIRRDRLSMESVTTSAACRCGLEQRSIANRPTEHVGKPVICASSLM
jgi:hypothetical protein